MVFNFQGVVESVFESTHRSRGKEYYAVIKYSIGSRESNRFSYHTPEARVEISEKEYQSLKKVFSESTSSMPILSFSGTTDLEDSVDEEGAY